MLNSHACQSLQLPVSICTLHTPLMSPMPDTTHFTKTQSNIDREEEEEETITIDDEEMLSQECKEMILSLPREKGWRTNYIYLFQGFWCQSKEIQGIITFQNHFIAKDSDVVVSSIPKSGTTWLKALTFSILNRNRFAPSSENHPLLNSNPHNLVPFLEYNVFEGTHDDSNVVPDILSNMQEPRIFGTHIPFPSLAESIKEHSNCKIIYICRNPLDTFVSTWFFMNKIKPESLPEFPLDDAFEKYCNGVIGFGPWWNHMLGYWKQSIENPKKVLFLKYEDLKADVNFHVKKLAEFLGCPFTLEEEESGGVVETIIKMCSFEKMKELEANKLGRFGRNFETKHLFRKAEIGDWVNHIPPEMVEKMCKMMDEKLGGSGLSFRVHT